MSIKTEIDRIKQSKADIISALTNKGVTVPSDASIDDLSALVDAISTSEDLSSELTTQETLLTSQTSKLSDVVSALVGKASGGGSDSTNKIHTGGSIGFVEDSGSYIGFLSFDSTTEFKDGEICKINFADFMELMTSDELTTVSEDIVLRYNSMFDNYSASVDVDLSRFGYGVYNIGISILPSLGAAMLMYEPEDTSQEPLNIGIWLEQTGRVADL